MRNFHWQRFVSYTVTSSIRRASRQVMQHGNQHDRAWASSSVALCTHHIVCLSGDERALQSVWRWNVDRRVETAERRQAVSWPCVTGQCDDARLPRPAYAVSRRACRLDAAVTSHVVRHLDVRWSRRRRRLTTGTRRYAAAPYAHRTRIDTY